MNRKYCNKIIDYTDEDNSFIQEFNREISDYGAIVYNHETNSYQFIKEFDHIDFKHDLLPFYFMITEAPHNLNSIVMTMSYEFDPDQEEDEENLQIWEELKETELAMLDYDEDGDVKVKSYFKLNPNETKHTIWFLNKEGYQELFKNDLLLITPIIKNIKISQKLIKEYGINPLEIESEYIETGQDDIVENLNYKTYH